MINDFQALTGIMIYCAGIFVFGLIWDKVERKKIARRATTEKQVAGEAAAPDSGHGKFA